MLNLPSSGITFLEDEHKYYLGNKELSGITSTIVSWMYGDTYDGISKKTLEEAAAYGKWVHKSIENWCKYDIADHSCEELQDFIELFYNSGYKVVDNEYIVTDKKFFASAIDVVFQDKDDGVILADIKTTSELHKEKVTLQLAVYKLLFEKQTKLKVKGVVEIWLPKHRYGKKPKLVMLPMVDNKDTKKAINAYLAMEEAEGYRHLFEPNELIIESATSQDPSQYKSACQQIRDLEVEIKRLKTTQDELKAYLLENFRENGISKIENDVLRINYIAPSDSVTLDSKTLKEEMPDIYNKYTKVTKRSDSIKITVK